MKKDILNIPEMKRVSKEIKLATFGQFSKDRVRQDSQKRPKHRKLFRMQKSGLKKHPIVKHKKFKHFKPDNIWTLRKGCYSNAKWSKNGDFGKILNEP